MCFHKAKNNCFSGNNSISKNSFQVHNFASCFKWLWENSWKLHEQLLFMKMGIAFEQSYWPSTSWEHMLSFSGIMIVEYYIGAIKKKNERRKKKKTNEEKKSHYQIDEFQSSWIGSGLVQRINTRNWLLFLKAFASLSFFIPLYFNCSFSCLIKKLQLQPVKKIALLVKENFLRSTKEKEKL